MQIHVPAKSVRRVLFSIWAFFVLAGFCVEAWKYILYLDRSGFIDDVLYFFGLSYEQNLPTWYSSSQLLICAVLLSLIARAKSLQKARYRWHWWVLALLFFYISLDEAVTLHESLSVPFDLDGVLYFGWVIPASIFVAVVGISFMPFLLHLPKRTRSQFLIAGIVFVGGALGVELVLGYWTDLHGTKNLGYGLIDLVEESMEILGISLFLLALLEYLAGPNQCIEINTRDDGQPA